MAGPAVQENTQRCRWATAEAAAIPGGSRRVAAQRRSFGLETRRGGGRVTQRDSVTATQTGGKVRPVVAEESGSWPFWQFHACFSESWS